MSSKVKIQISKSNSFTPDNIVKDIERPFDHTQTVDTLVEIEAQDLLPVYLDVYGRARYIVGESGSSEWSDTRHFKFLMENTEPIGFINNFERTYSPHPGTTWANIDKDGKYVENYNFRNNVIFNGIIDNVVDKHGNVFVEFPRFYYKIYPTGITDSYSVNCPCWVISPIKIDDSFRVHPAFIRGGKTYNKLRIAKYRCKLDTNNNIKSSPNDNLFLTNSNTTVEDLKNTVSRIDSRYRLFDVYDLSILRILTMLFTVDSKPVSRWFTYNDGDINSILKVKEFVNNNFCHYVDRVSLSSIGNDYIVTDHSTTNVLGNIDVNLTAGKNTWGTIFNKVAGSTGIGNMLLFLPSSITDSFGSIIGSINIEANTKAKYMFIHDGWKKTGTYTYYRKEYGVVDSQFISYYKLYPRCNGCPRGYTKSILVNVSYLNYYKNKTLCPYYTPNYNTPHGTITACKKTSLYGGYHAAASCHVNSTCGYYLQQWDHVLYCIELDGPATITYDCRRGYTQNIQGWKANPFTESSTVVGDGSIFSALYSSDLNNRTIRIAYNVD